MPRTNTIFSKPSFNRNVRHRRALRCPPVSFVGVGLLLSLSVCFPLSAQAGTWTEFGPSPIEAGAEMAGRMVALAAHPSNPNLLYAGSASGGLWRWDGSSWTPLTDHMPVASIGSIALDPKDPNTIYVGTGEPTYSSCSYYGLGIYKSKDGGETWTHLAEDEFGGRSVTQIAISPETGDIFASLTVSGEPKEHPDRNSGGGLFRSSDGGASWERVSGLPENDVSDFAFKPGNPKVMLAGLTSPVSGSAPASAGVYRSTDGGTTWTKLSGITSDPKKIAIAFSPADPNRIYVLAGGVNPTVYVSRNGGDSFTGKRPDGFNTQIQGHYDLCAVADPTDPNTAYFGGVQMIRTNDGGNSFRRITPAHTDIQRLAFDAAGTLIVAQDGGIHVSTSGGNSWSTRNRGLGTVQIYAGGALNSSDPNKMVGGLQDNGTVYRNGQLGWEMTMGADGGCNASHPDTPNVVFSEIYNAGNIYRSDNGGRSYQAAGSGIATSDRTSFLPPFVYHPQNPDVLFYGTQRMWRTTNRGQSWSAISGEVAGNGKAIRSIAISDDGKWLYVVTTGEEVHVSQDGGQNFKRVLSGIHGPRTLSKQIRVAPWDPKTAFLGVWSFETAQIQMTTDGGESWTSIEGDLIDVPVNTTEAFQIGDHRIVLAGTDRGIFANCDLDDHWRSVGDFFPTTPVVDLQFDAENERLVAFTFGRGAWVHNDANAAFWTELCLEVGDEDDDEDDEDDDSSSTGDSDDNSDSSENDDDTTDDSNSEESQDDNDSDSSNNSDSSEDDENDGSKTNDDESNNDDGDDDENDDSMNSNSSAGSKKGGGCHVQNSLPMGASFAALGLLGLVRRRRNSATVATTLGLGLFLGACHSDPAPSTPSATETKATPASIAAVDANHRVQASTSPQRGLSFPQGLRGNDLSVAIRETIDFSLDRPAIEGFTRHTPNWSDVAIQRFVVQIPGGDQDSITTQARVNDSALSYTFDRPGSHVLLFCTDEYAGEERLTYCNKTVLRVSDNEGRIGIATGTVAGKAGEPVEIRALMSPDRVRADSDLPIRVYWEGRHPEGDQIIAIAPDKTHTTSRIGERGVANVHINQTGTWIIRFEGRTEHRRYVGDLVFEVL